MEQFISLIIFTLYQLVAWLSHFKHIHPKTNWPVKKRAPVQDSI